MTEDDLVRRMVGRDLDELYPKQDVEAGDVALSVRRLTREGVFTDVSFDVRRGEIVGLAGLVGAGRTEVARAVPRRRPLGRRRGRGRREVADERGALHGHGRRGSPSSPRTGAPRDW